MPDKKIVVLGAGSMEFGLDSLAGIIRTEGLHGLELSLVDINAEKLALVKKMAERMNREWGADMTITATTQGRDALGGAGFVLLSVAVDREDAWQRDHEICWRHGVSAFAENGGPGGFAHAARNMGLVLSLLRDIEELAPRATLLNFTNPLTRLVTLVHKNASIPCVGICHGIGIGYFIVAVAFHKELDIQLPPDPSFKWRDDVIEFFEAYQEIAKARYEIRAAGINHFTWILDIFDRQTGQSVYPTLKEKMNELPECFEPLTQDMFRMFGLVPVQSDTHVSEYVSYTADVREGTWQRYNIQLYDFEWSKRRRVKNLAWIQAALDGSEDITPLKSAVSERAEFIIDGILNNRHGYEEAVNIPNGGCIPNLPPGSIVEVPGMVDAAGIHGLEVGPLPPAIAELCRRQLAIDDMLADAFVKGDRNIVYQAFAIDPMIQDLKVARNLADDLIDANREYFGVFS